MRRRSTPDAPLKILLVRPRLIGDVLLTTPVIRAMRRRYPDAESVYLVEAHAAPVVAANPHLSETIVIRHRRGLKRVLEDLWLARRLRARRFDVAVDMHGGTRSGWLTFATGARMRVGYDVSGRTWMYTHIVARPAGTLPGIPFAIMWDLARSSTSRSASADPARDRLEMPVTPAAAARSTRRLDQLGVTAADESRGDARRCGERVQAMARSGLWRGGARAGRGPRRVVLVVGRSGRGNHRSHRQCAQAMTRRRPAAVVAAPGWPLEELRALMDRAALFVGGDSGPMHIAAASDVPIVAIFGPTLPAHWAPWRPAQLAIRDRGARTARVPALRSAGVRARGFPLPEGAHAGPGRRRGEPPAGDTVMKTRGSTLELPGSSSSRSAWAWCSCRCSPRKACCSH